MINWVIQPPTRPRSGEDNSEVQFFEGVGGWDSDKGSELGMMYFPILNEERAIWNPRILKITG